MLGRLLGTEQRGVEEHSGPSTSGGAVDVKNPRGQPPAASSSRGGVLMRTASWMYVKNYSSLGRLPAEFSTYSTRKLIQ